MEEKDLNELQHPTWNPRRISTFDYTNLKQSIQTFGDLSGVVKNIQTGHLIGGNQRVEASKELGGKIVITHHTSETPNEQGTIAYGYIVLPSGEQYAYREVMWNEAKEREANIAANRIQGEWDADLLAEVNQQIIDLGGDLSLTGQTEDEIKQLLKATAPDPEPTDNQDDGMQSFNVRLTDEQYATIYQAIGMMKRERSLVSEPNPDLTANALYYIARFYVESHTQNQESHNIETPDPADVSTPDLPAAA